MTASCPAEYIAIAETLADAARPIAQRYFRAGIPIEAKADDSPVTKADREIETALREILAERRGKRGRLEYLIAWEGYDATWNTWEPSPTRRRQVVGATDCGGQRPSERGRRSTTSTTPGFRGICTAPSSPRTS